MITWKHGVRLVVTRAKYNTVVEERRKGKEEKQHVNLQPADIQEPRHRVREEGEPYINVEETIIIWIN